MGVQEPEGAFPFTIFNRKRKSSDWLSESSDDTINLPERKEDDFCKETENTVSLDESNLPECSLPTTPLDEEGDFKPHFTRPFNRPDEPLPLQLDGNGTSGRFINRYIARYLLPHQVEGVKWLWCKYALKRGAILG
jgi:hypothetical protein